MHTVNMPHEQNSHNWCALHEVLMHAFVHNRVFNVYSSTYVRMSYLGLMHIRVYMYMPIHS